MSVEQGLNDLLNQRTYYLPTPLVLINGVVRLPYGTVFDARLATVELSGQFLDQIAGENIVQGRSLTNPNTVDDTDVTRSLLVSSYNTSLTDGHGNSLLSDDTCSISSTGTSDSITFSKVTGSTNSYLLNTTTGSILNCDIENSNASYIRNTGSNALQRCAIKESDGSYIDAGVGQIQECNLNSTEACSISSGSGNVTISEISNSGLCSISASVGSLNENKIDGSQSCTIQNNQSLFPFQKNTIIGSGDCNINANIPGSFGGNAIVHCSTCNCLGTECLIAASVSSNITATSSNSQARQAAILASEGCSISPTLNRAGDCGIIGGYTTTFGTNAVRTVAAGIQFSGASNCDRCFMTGYGNTINGFTDVATLGGAATANGQIITNRRIDMTGTNQNFTNNGGYNYAAAGLVTPYRSSGIDTTLATTDGILYLTASSLTVTIPSAASMSANYPLGSVREFIIGSVGSNTLNLASGTFRNLTGWTRHQTSSASDTTRLVFVNDSVTPFWSFGHPITYLCEAVAATNYFGLTPPKSDAAQLPTSTSQATHQALTTTSYVTFTSILASSNAIFSIGTQGINCLVPGVYQFEFSINVKTATGGGNYLIRTDLCTTAGTTIGTSYVENGGVNTVPGTSVITYKTNRHTLNTPGVLTVRLSQDSANLINASASILSVKLVISAYF